VEPFSTGPEVVLDDVARYAAELDVALDHPELVGLAPAGVLRRIDPERWEALGLSPDATIEARLAERALLSERDASLREHKA
jgi:hypothetical protein